jgi:hypothetical protein
MPGQQKRDSRPISKLFAKQAHYRAEQIKNSVPGLLTGEEPANRAPRRKISLYLRFDGLSRLFGLMLRISL